MNPLAEVAPGGPDALAPLLDTSLAVRVRAAISAERAETWAAGVQGARDAWVSDFDGAQFSVGRAWYTHLEQGRAADYFANVSASDAIVERACPGLQAAMRELASRRGRSDRSSRVRGGAARASTSFPRARTSPSAGATSTSTPRA